MIMRIAIVYCNQFCWPLNEYDFARIKQVGACCVEVAFQIICQVVRRRVSDAGITENLIRIAVGLEDVEDLKDDLRRGLGAIGAP